jgi:hypothetical protein
MGIILNAFSAEGAFEYDPFMNLVPVGMLSRGNVAEMHRAAKLDPLNFGYDGLEQYAEDMITAEERVMCASGTHNGNPLPKPLWKEYGIQHMGRFVGSASIYERQPIIWPGSKFDGHDAVSGLQLEVAAWVSSQGEEGYSRGELIRSAITILLTEIGNPREAYTLVQPSAPEIEGIRHTQVTTTWVGKLGTRELIRYRRPPRHTPVP